MAGYVYKGKEPITLDEARDRAEKKPTAADESPTNTKGTPRQRRAVAACGTPSGYQRHLRLSEEACRPCKDAHADEKARRRGSTRRYTLEQPEHGSRAGYQRHKRRGEQPCFPCSEARRLYQIEYRRKKSAEVTRGPSTAERKAETAARIAELEHLAAGGYSPAEAALRAGWPNIAAAARTLYRYGHPLASKVESARRAA